MRPRLYLSQPITLGNRTQNFAAAANYAEWLMRNGFAVLNPGLSALWPQAWNIDHRIWIENDLAWIAVADVVFRLPGESAGADEETRFAELEGIPVISTHHELLAWKQTFDAARPNSPNAARPRSVANGT